MSWWDPHYVEPPPMPTIALDPALQTLTGKQRFVIELRFGLKDGVAYTQEEIAEVMGISQPAVWKIETAALNRLRKGL